MPPVQDEIEAFRSYASCERRRSTIDASPADAWAGIPLANIFVGAAAIEREDCVEVGLSIHDGTYSIDFQVAEIRCNEGETVAESLRRAAKDSVDKFCQEHSGKFIGAGITSTITKLCPDIAEFLWLECDMIVMAFNVHATLPSTILYEDGDEKNDELIEVAVDEQADSAVRKLIMHFGPQNIPMLSIGFRNRVDITSGGRIQLIHSFETYEKTVSPQTSKVVRYFADRLRQRRVKIAFFSSTPQGGGVALMRHALMRFYRLIGVSADWYIPKPNPGVFRITKNNHNILQGVSHPDERFDQEKQDKMADWITSNANRYWLSPGGPLAKGGADVVVIDDPQMPGLIPLIREARPEVKIIYRSHIEIRSDLVEKEGSPQAEVWEYLWDRIKLADVFISHPVNSFVPHTVPAEIVALMPATTDWLDGLNKPMRDWDLRYYHHFLRNECHNISMTKLQYPARDYITQVARFDPSKGIPTVLEAYRKLRDTMAEDLPGRRTPQLLICGHGAIDDPDGSLIYDEAMNMIDQPEFDDYRSDIVVLRLGPSDQLLNAVISTAKIVWQLSSREGFEAKVSEALHKGKPVVATRAGGIPLQIQDGKTGFLVDVGDADAVAERSLELICNEKKWREMSKAAAASVSDEVSTVGNAVCWMYLGDRLSRGEELKPNGAWVADMAREAAGVPWDPEENRLPRGGVKVIA